jgi:hypothetical protein
MKRKAEDLTAFVNSCHKEGKIIYPTPVGTEGSSQASENQREGKGGRSLLVTRVD